MPIDDSPGQNALLVDLGPFSFCFEIGLVGLLTGLSAASWL